MSQDCTDDPRRRGGHHVGLAYHAELVADPHRVTAYERAVRALVRPGDVVLDLGAGTGLLSVLAARRGARVHAVESADVAEVAAQVFRDNGVADRITLHRADFCELAPVEPVDVVISDFMGRFVTDDRMLDAVEAAAAWMKPDARSCPSRLRLLVAPVALPWFGPLDAFEAPVLGVDLRAARERADFGAVIPPEALLAEPQQVAELVPPGPFEPVAAELEFEIRTDGRLRALAGWFEADLAPGVTISTAPGVQTHWGQQLFPLPAAHVEPGQRLTVSLANERATDRWACVSNLHVQRIDPPTADAEALHAEGADAFGAGDLQRAAELFDAATSALGPDQDELARAIYEDLGIARLLSGRAEAAITPLLRARDGDPARSEQVARLLVDACFRAGRMMDGQRFLRDYEAHFGAHPAGWTRR